MVKASYVLGACLSAFEERAILCAFHDIDGTHSLIREWPPVMSAVLNDVIANGLPDDFDNFKNQRRLIALCGKHSLPETDMFCAESAGLSALTQMEWAIRRAVEENTITVVCDRETNHEIIERIWSGEEVFPHLPETPEMKRLLHTQTPRLFKLYEKILNGYCRNRNLTRAKREPSRFLVKGSLAFLQKLHDFGVKNYFVTGAVVQRGKGIYEEVETLGFSIGENRMVEGIIGSAWDRKLPKDEIMKALQRKLKLSGTQILVTGDGRSEISAGVKMGALTVSRLEETALRQRSLHHLLGTTLIVRDFMDPTLGGVLQYVAN